jgi:hypothetical protein
LQASEDRVDLVDDECEVANAGHVCWRVAAVALVGGA